MVRALMCVTSQARLLWSHTKRSQPSLLQFGIYFQITDPLHLRNSCVPERRAQVGIEHSYGQLYMFIFMFAPCIINIQNIFVLFQLVHTIIKFTKC
jgi:hypothetical protein